MESTINCFPWKQKNEINQTLYLVEASEWEENEKLFEENNKKKTETKEYHGLYTKFQINK